MIIIILHYNHPIVLRAQKFRNIREFQNTMKVQMPQLKSKMMFSRNFYQLILYKQKILRYNMMILNVLRRLMEQHANFLIFGDCYCSHKRSQQRFFQNSRPFNYLDKRCRKTVGRDGIKPSMHGIGRSLKMKQSSVTLMDDKPTLDDMVKLVRFCSIIALTETRMITFN